MEKKQLTEEEAEKVALEPNILKEIRALESGEPLEAAREVAKPASLPPSPEKVAEEASPSFTEAQDAGASPQACETEPAREEPVAEVVEKVQEEEVAQAEAPQLEPAEAEKRIKALKKKLVQIEKLKEKENLSAEEKEKVSRKACFEAEIEEMEINLLDSEAKKNAINLQRKLE